MIIIAGVCAALCALLIVHVLYERVSLLWSVPVELRRREPSRLPLIVHVRALAYTVLLLGASHVATCVSSNVMRFEALLWWICGGSVMLAFFYLKYIAAPYASERSMSVFAQPVRWNYVNQRIALLVWTVNPRYSVSALFQLACWLAVEAFDLTELYLLLTYAVSLRSCMF